MLIWRSKLESEIHDDDGDDEPDKIPTHHLEFYPLGFCPLGFIPTTIMMIIASYTNDDDSHHDDDRMVHK